MSNFQFGKSTKTLGKHGEDIAVNYLRQKGYKIRERNYRTKLGEVDIIAEHGGFLIFVEVKYRTSLSFGRPEEAVDMRKLYKLRRMVDLYYVNNRPKWSPKIEVLSIWKEGEETKIKHLQGIVF